MASPPAAPATNPTSWPTLNSAERGALRELLIHGPMPRAEIARRLGISRTSLTRVTRELMEHGLVSEGAAELNGTAGRPGELLHVRPQGRSFLGVNLTADRLFAAVTDLEARVLVSHDEALDSGGVEDTIAQIGRVRERLVKGRPDIAAAGIALAGDVVTSTGRQIVTESPFLGWRQVALADLAEQRLGVPVATENDVRCLTAAEHWFGVGAGFDLMALITVGFGIGFGLVVDGKIVTGGHGKAGRLDHLPIDRNGPLCEYGHRGCVTAFLPNAAIVGAMRTPGLDYEAVVALARSGDPAAVRAFRDAAYALGVLVATLANTFDPEKIVITGEGIPVAELARSEMDSAIAATLHPTAAPVVVDIQPFEFTEWARAAAVLAIRDRLQF
ncbi:putative NBD/HSP70 family sugar kinase [Saccharothrix ecbatanensis]|uniref:Putative NBD/HSP70 family sugar kinase n=1 Tax=Saccharothrix ecbatanensis TaxID=1105145 RepID=A0A7W9M138_9PSEU|nr:ROK family transcriptional regulator [Saccharothrix ecbatanensis]MBB5803560.1 putative NBD/HSP70 family sugar kinase [Saccharothrix ecbatanensis]